MQLQDQVIVLTGASGGIGAPLTRLLVEQGARVVVAARDPERLRELCAGLPDGQVLPVPTDVQDWAQVSRLAEQAMERFDRVDVLINNAGVAHYAPLTELTPEQISWQVNVNLTGPLFCCRALLPFMLKRGAGQILNVASVLGIHGRRDAAAYCATKFGMMGLTESLKFEVGPRGIRVMALCPGMVNTAFSNLPEKMKLDGLAPETVAGVALQMLLTPADGMMEQVVLPARGRIG